MTETEEKEESQMIRLQLLAQQKIILIQQSPKRNFLMKRGHRRTQSANISYVPMEDMGAHQQNAFQNQNRHQIVHLLSRCEAKIIEKICNVESLNTPTPSLIDPLFNFGKGLLKSNLDQRQKDRNFEYLISIPQKCKQGHIKSKKPYESEANSKNKLSKNHQSSLKIGSKDYVRSKVPFKDVINRIIKDKDSTIEEHRNKKHSFLDLQLKSSVRLGRHKKEISNFK